MGFVRSACSVDLLSFFHLFFFVCVFIFLLNQQRALSLDGRRRIISFSSWFCFTAETCRARGHEPSVCYWGPSQNGVHQQTKAKKEKEKKGQKNRRGSFFSLSLSLSLFLLSLALSVSHRVPFRLFFLFISSSGGGGSRERGRSFLGSLDFEIKMRVSQKSGST